VINTAELPSEDGLSVSVEGPSKSQLIVVDDKDKCRVTYLPSSPGLYHINILYAQRHIDGSPFHAKIFSHLASSPHLVGDHFVSVFKHDRQTKRTLTTPHYAEELERGGPDGDKVKAKGRGLFEGRVNEIEEFFVDTSEAVVES